MLAPSPLAGGPTQTRVHLLLGCAVDSSRSWADALALYRRARGGDIAAGNQLFAWLRALRKRRRQADDEDVILEVLSSLLKKPDYESTAAFRRAVLGLIKDKAIQAERRATASKRGGRKKPSGDPALLEGSTKPSAGPQERASLGDELTWLKAHVSEIDSRILELKLDGFSEAEIAAQIGFHERTIRKHLKTIRTIYEEKLRGKNLPPPRKTGLRLPWRRAGGRKG